MNSELIEALKQLEREKKISAQTILDALEQALATAYKRNHPEDDEIEVSIDPETGEITVFAIELSGEEGEEKRREEEGGKGSEEGKKGEKGGGGKRGEGEWRIKIKGRNGEGEREKGEMRKEKGKGGKEIKERIWFYFVQET